MTASADLTFIHISDIHFRDGHVDSSHDLDRELRRGLEEDFRHEVVKNFTPISGIIVTGDIAWGGAKREYQFAEGWIKLIAGHLQCAESNVMVIPGNHDVHRPTLKKDNSRIEKIQRNVRHGGDAEVCVDKLSRTLISGNGKVLLSAIGEYNKFAKKFGCSISADKPYWERTYPLGDGSNLVIRGITSTFLSGPKDSENERRLLYGTAQYNLSKLPETHYVVAGHHPPDNMIDGVKAEKNFDFYCRLQLFGHKHESWIKGGQETVRIIAGALQPERRERQWIPRYNIIQISGELTEKSRLISVRVYPRRWSEEYRVFMPDFGPHKEEVRIFEFFVPIG